MSFINTFYQELNQLAKFPPKAAWLLVGRCVGAVFDARSVIRSNGGMLDDPGVLHTKTQFIWAVLQGHRVVTSFTVVQFRGHTAIGKELSLFMLTERVDPSELTTLAGKVTVAENAAVNAKKEVKTMEGKVASLGENYTTLKRKHDNRQLEHEKLKKKVA
jgi:hypothetical protein